MYRDLIFDLYGTLADIRTVEDMGAWKKAALFFCWQGASCTASWLKNAYSRELAIRAKRPYEEVPVENIFAAIFRQLGITKNARSLGAEAARIFRIASTRHIRLYPGVLQALARFREKGCRLWLLSNAQAVFTLPELRLLGLDKAFDGIYLSSQHGCCKPRADFFLALLNEQRLDPKACLMIGNDLETDIRGAKELGLATLYLHTAQTPADQPPADPKSPAPHWQFEGADWIRLAPFVETIL